MRRTARSSTPGWSSSPCGASQHDGRAMAADAARCRCLPGHVHDRRAPPPGTTNRRQGHAISRRSAGAFLYPVAIAATFVIASDSYARYAIAVLALALGDPAGGIA